MKPTAWYFGRGLDRPFSQLLNWAPPLYPFWAPESFPILFPSSLVANNGFPAVKALRAPGATLHRGNDWVYHNVDVLSGQSQENVNHDSINTSNATLKLKAI